MMKTIRMILQCTMICMTATGCMWFGEQKNSSQNLSPKEFRELFNKRQGVFIDLRKPSEYQEEMIEGALNIDMESEDFKTKIAELDKSKCYFLYSGSGELNEKASAVMKEKGFDNFYALEGGINKWKADGLAVSKPIASEETVTGPSCVGAKPITDYTDPKVNYVREISPTCDTSFEVITKGKGFMGVGKFANSSAYNKEVSNKLQGKKGRKK